MAKDGQQMGGGAGGVAGVGGGVGGGGGSGQVHWHEGLFLQSHHLQTMQRSENERSERERKLRWSFPYGVIDSRLSLDALENMLVRFDRLRVVMPSGLEVDIPENTDLPALDIKRVFASGSGAFTVSVAVPLWQSQRGNTVDAQSGISSGARTPTGVADSTRVKRIYKVAEVERLDENTGENRQAVMVRRINAKLVVEGDDTSDMEVLPLVRIAHATGEELGRPQQDKTYVPPCLLLAGSGALRTLLRDLGNQLETTRREQVIELTRGGFSMENLRGIQYEALLRLRTLNVYAGRIPLLATLAALTPVEAYLEMRSLHAELAGLAPDRDPWEAPRYDHDNPGVCFFELDRRIRQLLSRAVASKFIKVNFERDGAVLAAALEDKHLTKPNDYFLGIKTKADPLALAKLVEDGDKFKLVPRSMERMMIFGVRLAEERHPPYELPAQVGLNYFRLLRTESKSMWDRIVSEKKMALRWPDSEKFEFSEVSLYMTVPGDEA